MADDAREKLAAALCEQRNGPGGWDHEPGRRYWLEDANALLAPGGVVDEIAGKRAAEELRAAGRDLYRLAVIDVPDWLHDRADALDAEPNPEPEPVAHNHTRFRNVDGGPWSPCPVSCPAAGLLR